MLVCLTRNALNVRFEFLTCVVLVWEMQTLGFTFKLMIADIMALPGV